MLEKLFDHIDDVEKKKNEIAQKGFDPDRRLDTQDISKAGVSAENRIGFDRHLDKQDSLTENPSTERRIDPDRRLGAQGEAKENSGPEADVFCKAENSLFQEESDIPPEEDVLTEIFYRSEDEISIDFEVDEDLRDCLSRFAPDRWRNADVPEQLMAMEELKDKIAEKLGLKNPPEIKYYEWAPDIYGSYSPEYNSLLLNTVQFDDPVELVNTIAHEMRHAWQHERADAMENRQDALFRANFDNYITPVSIPGIGYVNFMEYEGQYVEVDARVFASKITEAMT